MPDRIVVRVDLPAQVEELIVLVGRERLLDLVLGARTWDLQRGDGGLTLTRGTLIEARWSLDSPCATL